MRKPRRPVLALPVLIALALAAGVLAPVPSAAAGRVVDLSATAVGYTDLLHPRTSLSGADHASVSQTRYRSYVTFDTSGLPAHQRVVAASLVLTVGFSAATRPGFDVRQTSSSWDPQHLTHDSRPEPGDVNLTSGSTAVASTGSTVELGLDDVSAVASGSDLSLALSYTQPLVEVQVSRTVAPVLRVTFATPGSVGGAPYTVAPTGSSARKVFAHYMPPYPISLDNLPPDSDYYATNYLRPEGEGGKFAAVGGFTRDRPRGRDPLAGDWQLADAMTEVQQASEHGIDGFTVNLMSWSGPTWERSLRIAAAAGQSGTGFVTVPNLDLTSAAADAPIPTIAAKLAEFYAEPSAYRLDDGRLVLSSFRAEARPVAWWQDLMATLSGQYGVKVAFIGVMLDLNQERITEFAPISYALGNWGVRTSTSIQDSPPLAKAVHAAGVRWMAPVAVQDVRYVPMLYAEAGNTETLRASWARADQDEADLVQLVTWNDYAESTQFAPSSAHGESFLDVNGYYLTRFKSGREPELSGDELVVTHRVQRVDDQPTQQGGVLSPTLSGQSVIPRDTVEVVCLLQAPATVTLVVGTSQVTFDAPAGMSQRVAPLVTGTVAAAAVRGGRTVASVSSPYPVVSPPARWDLQYYGASSRGR